MSHVNTAAAALALKHVPGLYAPSLFVTVFGLCAYDFLFNGVLAKVFSWDYLRWAGNMSDSYYLAHPLTLHTTRLIVNAVFPPAPRSVLFDVVLMLVCLLATLAAAAVMFFVIEKPISLPAHDVVREKEARAVAQHVR